MVQQHNRAMKKFRSDLVSRCAACLGAMFLSAAVAAAPRIMAVPGAPAGSKRLPPQVSGRVSAIGQYQWPGLYFESKVSGRSVYFETGPGDVILHVLVDDVPAGTLVKPRPGVWLIDELGEGSHVVRIEAVTESQDAPNAFAGFVVPSGSRPMTQPPRKRQIEFIGDSHTVGYGNTSKTRDCTEDDVWSTTDSSAAFGPKVARHYDADFQVNAISGRGIVRNYDGSDGDPLPIAYPFVLLDHATRYANPAWRPQVIVIALGTNDFSTPLHAGEKWATRDALHADYESTYVKFLEDLRARNPGAYFVIWATELAEREIQVEANKVVELRKSRGDRRIEFLPVDGLAMTGCNWHPSVTDDDVIAAKLVALIDARKSWDGH
jgi:lysophospholipase L1-like esterase